MIHEILPVGVLRCNCSIFGEPSTGEAFVIDPGDDIDRIERILAKHNLTVKAIVVTHAHIDHVAGAKLLKEKTGAPVYLNENDAELLGAMDVQAGWLGMATPEVVDVDSNATDGTLLRLGANDFEVRHTPGHTQGSISLYLPQAQILIAGDTLFRDSIGRTDLPGGDGRQILRSIAAQLLPLPDDTVVIPGHGANTTIGRERERNPFLRKL